jgi:hypothetical protein
MHAKRSINHPPSHRRRAILTGLSVLALAGLYAPQARAGILRFSTNTAGQVFTSPNPTTVNLGAAGLIAQFTVPTAGLIEITFSAECSVNGTQFQHGTISIEIKPAAAGAGAFAAISPTGGSDDAFCSGNNVAGVLDGYVTASMTVVTPVDNIAYDVRVRANTVGGAPEFRLDDLSLTVDQ